MHWNLNPRSTSYRTMTPFELTVADADVLLYVLYNSDTPPPYLNNDGKRYVYLQVLVYFITYQV